MVAPVRFPSGVSNMPPWQMLGAMGMENPFFYHMYADDFDEPLASIGWATTATTGTAALTSGDGGLALLSTAATLNDFVAIQRPVAGFVPVAGKKLFFTARIALADVALSAFVAGIMPVTATPFANPANGIWISKASGSSQLVLNVANNGVVTSTNLPASAYALANGVSLDIGFSIDASGAIKAAVAPNMVANAPQSGTGAANSTNRSPNVVSPVTLASAAMLAATPLAPVLAVQAGAAAIKTLTSDFVLTARER